MGAPTKLVLPHEQISAPAPSARMRAKELFPAPNETCARRSRPLHSQTLVLVCRLGSEHQPQERRPRRNSCGKEIAIHPAGENAFRTGDRDTFRQNEG